MEQSPDRPRFVGIDVSKDRLDVHVCPSGQAFSAPRHDRGLEQLVNDLRSLAPALMASTHDLLKTAR